MLSYQHEYHAGNHADILKHICLVSILDSLCKKEKPFTIIDTHSGGGRFHLNDERLLKTGEAKEGISKFFDFVNSSSDVPEAVKRYAEIQSPYYNEGLYAGSPEIERLFLRKGDISHLIEKHPQALQSLNENIKLPVLDSNSENPVRRMQGKCVVHDGDSYRTVSALVPPLVKRGLVLCDPSYEEKSDYEQVTRALENVHKKWNTAIIALWYPILERKKNETTQMLCYLEDNAKLGLNPCEVEKFELPLFDFDDIPSEMKKEDGSHMIGSGMLIINPPWQLKEKMTSAIDFLKKIFC